MSDPLKTAAVDLSTVTAIPQEILEQALALVNAFEAHPDLGVTVVFSSKTPQTGPLPMLMAGFDPVKQPAHLLQVALGMAQLQGIPIATALQAPLATTLQAPLGECTCPACQARRAADRVVH